MRVGVCVLLYVTYTARSICNTLLHPHTAIFLIRSVSLWLDTVCVCVCACMRTLYIVFYKRSPHIVYVVKLSVG